MQHIACKVNPPSQKKHSDSRQTNKELEALRPSLFNHATSGRYLSTRILFKIIAGRYIKYRNCVTKQDTLGVEMESFGYGKGITGRQVRKMSIKLRDAGLISYERSTKNRASVYSYSVTELGLQCFDYFIRRNVQKLSTVPVNKKHWPKKPHLENEKKVPVETKKSSGREVSQPIDKYNNQEKKFRSNRYYINNIGATPVSSFNFNKKYPSCGKIARIDVEARKMIDHVLEHGDGRYDDIMGKTPTLKANPDEVRASIADFLKKTRDIQAKKTTSNLPNFI